jgi:hypothetical protein
MARVQPGQPVVFNAGEHCRFCVVGAALKCPLTTAVFQNLAINDFVNQPITERDLGNWKELIPVARMQMNWIEEEAMRRAEQGKQIPGFKLVAKQAKRIWKDGVENEIAETLGKDAYSAPELKSPAQIEKLESLRTSRRPGSPWPRSLTIASVSNPCTRGTGFL